MGKTKMKKAKIVPQSLRRRKRVAVHELSDSQRYQQLQAFNLGKHGSVGEELQEEDEDDEEGDVDDLIGDADNESESEDIDGLMSDDDLAQAIEDSPEGTTVVPLAETVEMINRVLPQGLDIPVEGPNAVTEQSFNRDFSMLVTIAEGANLIPTSEEKAEEDGEGIDDGLTEGGDELNGGLLSPEVIAPEDLPAELADHPMVKAMIQLQEPLVEAIKGINKRLDAQDTSNGYDLKETFRKGLKELIQTGQMTKAQGQSVLDSGKKHGYDLALLEPFLDGDTVIDLGSRSRSFASNRAPSVDGVNNGAMDNATCHRLAQSINPSYKIPKSED
jgi:hypothetical protein